LDIDATSRRVHASRVTLPDLLVSTAVLGLTLGAALTTLEQGQRAWEVGAARVEAQQSGRAALAWLAAELRTAGQGPGPRRIATLTIIEPARVVLRVDRNRDGVIAGGPEEVTWRLVGDILRRDAGGGAQPVVNAVRALRLAYFDAAGAPTAEPGAVRRISITLVTRAERALALDARGLAAVFSTDVQLRNQ
jgi:type II secretory pathway component PulJ